MELLAFGAFGFLIGAVILLIMALPLIRWVSPVV